MNTKEIKEFILYNNQIEYILEELNCHHVRPCDGGRYYTFGMPDGDNTKSTYIYADEYMTVVANTRDIKDEYGNSDLFSLICFLKDMYMSHAIKWLCDILGLDYYSNEEEVELPLSLQITQLLKDINEHITDDDEKKVQPISELVLNTYIQIPNKKFLDEGISIKTQEEFELGMDLYSQRITIPIRDELGTLVGVKGRKFDNNTWGDKYIYLENCAKTRICYGLYKTMQYIKSTGKCIVVESEKSVLKLWEYGIKNVVAIGGHDISRYQVEMITRLGIEEVIFCYDEDVARNAETGKIEKEYYIKESDKFIDQIKKTAMVDIKGTILNKKESPADNKDKFDKLYKERKMV